jgi:hypothetical protein
MLQRSTEGLDKRSFMLKPSLPMFGESPGEFQASGLRLTGPALMFQPSIFMCGGQLIML